MFSADALQNPGGTTRMARQRPGRDADDDLPPAKISRESLREAGRLFRYLWPYRLKFVGAVGALSLSSLLGLAFPYVTGQLVNSAIGQPGASPIAGWGVDGIAVAMMVVLAMQALFSFLQSIWFIEVGERSLCDLRRDAYARLIRLPMAFHVKRRVGELSSRIAADLAQIQDTLTGALPQFLRQSAMLVGGVILIAS
jgi:ABC-type multidrug transport system fused ATPase/permease subunit